jgi:hypothetical protein
MNIDTVNTNRNNAAEVTKRALQRLGLSLPDSAIFLVKSTVLTALLRL